MTAVSSVVAERAHDLLEERRVFLTVDGAVVLGASGVWVVTAEVEGVWCDCPARGVCSHVAAVMVAAAEVAS